MACASNPSRLPHETHLFTLTTISSHPVTFLKVVTIILCIRDRSANNAEQSFVRAENPQIAIKTFYGAEIFGE